MTRRPELRGSRGSVSATHWLSAAAGASMFDRGGNAADAAVAAAFVSQVVEPHLNGPAGDVPILVHDGATGGVDLVCGQGPMPQAATIGAFRELGLDVVPGSGLLPAVVPGAFGAWMRLLAERGRLRVADVLEPAIGYARHGFPLLPPAARMIGALAPLFRTEWTGSGRTWLDGGEAPAAGARVRNPDLAAVFERLVREAAAAGSGRETQVDGAVRAFYQGFVAEAIDEFCATGKPIDATGRRHGGLLTGADMASWEATVERPVTGRFGGRTVHKAGPWSQGPVFLQQLAFLEGAGLDAVERGGVEHIHTVVEGAKLAFADREAHFGDPLHAPVPLDALLDPGYLDARRRLIGDRAADPAPGDVRGGYGWAPAPPPAASTPGGPDWMYQLDDGVPAVVARTQASGDTCCITAADGDGNLVVASPSGGWLKSSPVIPGLGFPLGTRGQMAWLVEGHPNSLAPGKRPRTTLSPTLVTRDGRPEMAFGTPGGDQQDQWTFQFFCHHVLFGLGMQEAVEAPTFHTDHVPSSFVPRTGRDRGVVVEDDVSEGVVAGLRARGHDVSVVPAQTLGKVCVTGFTDDGQVIGAASPRGAQAYAVVR